MKIGDKEVSFRWQDLISINVRDMSLTFADSSLELHTFNAKDRWQFESLMRDREHFERWNIWANYDA